MHNLNIPETPMTPNVQMNTSGICTIEGTSRPEDPNEFFAPIFEWLDDYFEESTQPLELNVQLKYFNTSSSKVLLDIFETLEDHKDDLEVKVVWIYEEDDDELLDAGEELLELVEIEYELREI